MRKKHLLFKISFAGFSLIEMIFAMGLVGGLFVVVMQMSKLQNQSGRDEEIRFQEEALTRIVSNTLTNAQACKNSFLNKKIPTTITDIMDKGPVTATAFAVNTNINGLIIQDMSLELILPASGLNLATGMPSGAVNLSINVKRWNTSAREAQSLAQTHKIKIPFYVQLSKYYDTTTATITGCIKTDINWSDRQCVTGSYLRGFSADGVAVCATPTSKP
ncbi:MAG: type II secretion system protein [Pseudomonadota bacterium]